MLRSDSRQKAALRCAADTLLPANPCTRAGDDARPRTGPAQPTAVPNDSATHPPDAAEARAFARCAAGGTDHAAFMTAVAHELRTPLTVVHGALALLAERPELDAAAEDGGEGAALLEMAQRNTARLLGVVEDALDLAAAEAGTLRFDPEPVAPADLFALLGGRAARVAAGRGVTLVTSVDSARGVRGDRPRLQRVVAHLVDNALDFAPAGSAVTVRATDGPAGALRLVVADEGPGISPARLAVPFERYTPRPAPGRQQVSGLGVGLAFCRAIVEAHGGTLTIESAPGSTVVACDLPPAWRARPRS
jgi:signal transduction histidine kinase